MYYEIDALDKYIVNFIYSKIVRFFSLQFHSYNKYMFFALS